MSVRDSTKSGKPLPPVSRERLLKRLAEIIRPGVLFQHCWNKTFWLVESVTKENQSGSTKATYQIREITNLHSCQTVSLAKLVSGFTIVSVPDDT